MSNPLKSKKKPELQALAAELGIDTEGSKSDLEARILQYLSGHVELKSDPKFSKYFASITGPDSPSPAATAPSSQKRRSIAAKKTTDFGEAATKTSTA
jgi:SAP domain-containing new25